MTVAPIRDVVRVEEREGSRGGRTLVLHLSCGCFLTRSSKKPPPKTARCIPCSVIAELPAVNDQIAERVIRVFWLYTGYKVESRGPAGCLVDILRMVAPRVADELAEHGAAETARRNGWTED